MTGERLLQRWEEKKPERSKIQITVAVREDLLEVIQKLSNQFRISRAQTINDILALGIQELERIKAVHGE